MKSKAATRLKAKLAIAGMLTCGIMLNSCSRLPDITGIFKIDGVPQLRLSYNSVTNVLDNGRRQTTFYTKWVNYMDGNNKWETINPNFEKTGRGFEMTQATFEVVAPFYADEEAPLKTVLQVLWNMKHWFVVRDLTSYFYKKQKFE